MREKIIKLSEPLDSRGRTEEDDKFFKGQVADQILALFRKEIEKCLPGVAFTDYPDTQEGRQAKYENSLWNSCRENLIKNLKDLINQPPSHRRE